MEHMSVLGLAGSSGPLPSHIPGLPYLVKSPLLAEMLHSLSAWQGICSGLGTLCVEGHFSVRRKIQSIHHHVREVFVKNKIKKKRQN